MPTRNVCFVTGTRAEFGLMARTLTAIRNHRLLNLQIVATGMHLDRSRGYSVNEIRRAGFEISATVPWRSGATSPAATAAVAGHAMSRLADVYQKLKTDIVLVVGDRVEAFAAASAAHIAGLCVAHVHGGDRAPGIVDDSLRHAITKLSHVHFPATRQSADRIEKLGEQKWRIHQVGSPGIDGIKSDAASLAQVTARLKRPLRKHRFRLLALHPESTDDAKEEANAELLLDSLASEAEAELIVIYPNNDPGSAGIIRAYERWKKSQPEHVTFERNLPRPIWLGLLRDAAVLIGNSSAGIIEAASFGTPVINLGNRQAGRERGMNVLDMPFHGKLLWLAMINWTTDAAGPRRFPPNNPYGGERTGVKIAKTLAGLKIDNRLICKLIDY